MLEFPPIRDIAPPVEPAAVAALPWIWWVAAGLLVGLLLWGLFLWGRSVGRRMTLPGLPAPPDQWALRALESLRLAAPRLEADAFAAELSRIVRTFLHRQTGVLAHYATSPEILGDRSRADQPPPPPVMTAFRGVLTASDALKYGPSLVDRTVQTDALIDSAIAAVRAATAPPAPLSPSGPAAVAGARSPGPPPLPSAESSMN